MITIVIQYHDNSKITNRTNSHCCGDHAVVSVQSIIVLCVSTGPRWKLVARNRSAVVYLNCVPRCPLMTRFIAISVHIPTKKNPFRIRVPHACSFTLSTNFRCTKKNKNLKTRKSGKIEKTRRRYFGVAEPMVSLSCNDRGRSSQFSLGENDIGQRRWNPLILGPPSRPSPAEQPETANSMSFPTGT